MYTILYVDDEEINLRIFLNTFRRDFKIFTADSAMKGLEILRNNKIDVVITDQRMPQMSGVELLKEIHLTFPSIPPNRFIVSGYAKDEEIELAYDEDNTFFTASIGLLPTLFAGG